MSEMPARIWVEDTRDGAWFGHPRSAYAVEYIRSDIAERMAAALERIERGGIAVLLDAALSDVPDGFDECPINPQVLQQMVDDARSALSAWKDGR